MNKPIDHIVLKQVIDLSIDKKLDAFQIQQCLSTLYYDEILPLLDTLFEQVSTHDETIIVDSLVVDLGIVNEGDLLSRYCIQNLLAAIREQVEEKIFRQGYKWVPSISRELKTLTAFRQWLFYMKNGHLPWNAVQPDDEWYTKVLEAVATDHTSVEMLRQLILNDVRVVERIVFQHSVVYLVHIAELLTAKSQDSLVVVVKELSEVIIHARDKKVFKTEVNKSTVAASVWKNILQIAANPNPVEELTPLVIARQLAGEIFGEAFSTAVSASVDTLKNLRFTSSVWKSLSQSKMEQIGEDMNDNRQDTNKSSFSSRFSEQIAGKSPVNDSCLSQIPSVRVWVNEENPLARSLSPNTIEEVYFSQDSDEQEIFVSHVGLVLLHPFLYLFAKNLGLCEEGKFQSILSQQKTVLLFHYLASGNDKPQEFELVMSKLLCGYPIPEIIDTSVELDKKYIEEADQLLNDVIGQWEIMKGTSAGGLREAFLSRNGKLEFRDDSIVLKVEKNSIDLLLDRLPWSMNYIKLPWMRKMLRVEWRGGVH